MTQPTRCYICRAPISQPAVGRPRRTCSSACRQRRYRLSHRRYNPNRQWDSDDRRARAALRQIERRLGPIDDTPPAPGVPGLRYRLFYRLVRGMPIHYCAWCRRPYIENAWGPLSRGCSPACQRRIRDFKAALIRALDDFLYDPRFDERLMVRLRIAEQAEALGDPISLHRIVGLCAHCGIPFPMYATHQKFCSKICRQRHHRARHPHCPVCGSRFTPSRRSGRKQVYCSKACRRGARRVPDPPRRVCPICKVRFKPNRLAGTRQIYCSDSCRMRSHRLPDPPCRVCPECKKAFRPDKRNAHKQVYCSKLCRSRYVRRQRQFPTANNSPSLQGGEGAGG